MPRSAILCLVLSLYLGPTTAALAMPTLVRTSQYSPARKRTAKRPRTNAFASPARKRAAPPAVQQHRHTAEAMTMQRAWLCSAVVPGWGQTHNKQYWKVPAIYAVFAALGWGAIYNHQQYRQEKRKLIAANAANESYPTNIKNYINDCRTRRDLCVIFAGIWYIINIFDAYAGASLKTFNLSDDISLEIQPSTLSLVQNTPTVGISLCCKF